MGRRKKSDIQDQASYPHVDYEPQAADVLCPTLKKAIQSDVIHLFDLASIQMELERALTGVMERLVCLSADAKGKSIPSHMVQTLQLRQTGIDPDSSQPVFGRPSLVVKANPDRPLTLIISQRTRLTQQQPASIPAFLQHDVAGPTRPKLPIAASYGRRASRSSLEDTLDPSQPGSPDKNQSSSSYAIPNKFWELMEPYCAEITEANIGYLEGLLKSYHDMDSVYFHLQPVKEKEVITKPSGVGVCNVDSLSCKRSRRVAQQNTLSIPTDSAKPSNTQQAEVSMTALRNGFCPPAPDLVQLARGIEDELRKPLVPNSSSGRLSQSLLNSIYQDNIIFSFTDGIDRISRESTSNETEETVMDTNFEDDWKITTGVGAHNVPSIDQCNFISNGINVSDTTLPSPSTSPLNVTIQSSVNQLQLPTQLRNLVTTKASQPIKNLAKQLHVSSSFRLEKKVSQAVDELGLFPLKLTPSCSKSDRSQNPVDYYHTIFSPHVTDHGAVVDSEHTSSLLTTNDVKPSVSFGRRRTLDVNQKRLPALCSVTKKRRTSPDGQCIEADNGISETIAKNDRDNSTETAVHNKLSASDDDFRQNDENKRSKVSPYKRKLRSAPVNTHNNGFCDPTTTHLSSPKYRDEPLTNGLLTTDDEDSDNDVYRKSDPMLRTPTKPKSSVDNSCPDMDCKPILANSFANIDPVSSPVNGDRCRFDLSNDNIFLSSETDCGWFESRMNDAGGTATGNYMNNIKELHSGLMSPIGDRLESDNNGVIHKASPEWILNCNSSDPIASPMALNCTRTAIVSSASSSCSSMEQKVDCESSLLPLPLPTTITGTATHAADEHFLTNSLGNRTTSHSTEPDLCDEVGWAIVERQQELRIVCAANHGVLRRLVRAARRDMQRQEIQRRLAIADADVIEAYNKLESYRPHRKPPLKRDRDMAMKALKERRKLLVELEAFDAKSP